MTLHPCATMPLPRPRPVRAALFAIALATAAHAHAQAGVTTPEAFFGHPIGADHVLPDYEDFAAYWQRLDAESDRIVVREIGRTAEGRPQWMAIVTSPDNHTELEHWREVSVRLARAEVGEEEARRLAREGRAVVWIDGGLHANETLGAQQLLETVYRLVSGEDEETLRILRDVVVLAVHANPDGMDLVSKWYMRHDDPLRRTTANLPRLYQRYVGHDNNRDFYASTQAETENMNRVLYHEWHPQIVYDHHQTGPPGTVMFAPPFRDPFNYVYDPLIVAGVDLLGAAMHTRFLAEGKRGVTMRRGASYSTWWNGGLRTTPYFHNILGLLSETIGGPTPEQIPDVPTRQVPDGDLPAPIAPQRWPFRNSIEYSVTANYAVLDAASRYREMLLFNRWRMGRNAIERGNRDSWTRSPRKVAAGLGPEQRDPRGYVLPADQPDFPTATVFVNALLETGVEVHRATAPFAAGGHSYPKGSYVVRTAQAFAPHVLDMFEPQDHPNDFQYPGGPPIPPYDAAGWTLAYQMGIAFDRILEPFEGPFGRIDAWNVAPPPGSVPSGSVAGYLLSPRYVDAYPAAVALMRQGERVYRLRGAWSHDGREHEPGTFYVAAGPTTRARVERLAVELGVSFTGARSHPPGEQSRLAVPRIALWDRYGGSIPSGWTRWILERHGIPFQLVYPQRLDAGALRASYDAIVLTDGAVPPPGAGRELAPPAGDIPAEYRDRLGSVTATRTVPQLREFLHGGGTVVAIGGSTGLARHLGLPVRNHLVDEAGRPLRAAEYFIPGSVLRTRVDPAQPVAHGLAEAVDVFFDNSPVFALGPEAEAAGIRAAAWFATPEPLRSGWAWGQERLLGGAAVVTAPVGNGTLYLFGPGILHRAQPRNTFKFLFNALAASASRPEPVTAD